MDSKLHLGLARLLRPRQSLGQMETWLDFTLDLNVGRLEISFIRSRFQVKLRVKNSPGYVYL